MSKEEFLTKENERLEEMKKRVPGFDKDAWPRLNKEKYSDCISRNFFGCTDRADAGTAGDDGREIRLFGGGAGDL